MSDCEIAWKCGFHHCFPVWLIFVKMYFMKSCQEPHSSKRWFGDVAPNLVRTNYSSWKTRQLFLRKCVLTYHDKSRVLWKQQRTCSVDWRLRKRKIGIPAFICEMGIASGPDDVILFLLENHPDKRISDVKLSDKKVRISDKNILKT